jgi:hypothetical protein
MREVMRSRWRLILAAAAIGVAVVAVKEVAFTLLTGRELTFAADVEPYNATQVAIPFLALALVGARTLLPWFVGLVLTVSLWGYALYRAVRYQWNSDDSGVDIGLALIMIFSPLFLTPIVLLVHAGTKRRTAQS